MPYKLKRSLFILAALLVCYCICIPLCRYKPHISEGELSFFRDNQLLKKISIQAVETDQYRMKQHLMYHDAMPDSCGMLFIFKDNGTTPFKMSKPHPAFDLIAADPNGTIVIIEKNVSPSSMQAIPVSNQILYSYIVIVNSGFCNSHSIRENDCVAFKLKDK